MNELTFGEKIKLLRLRLNISQQELSEKIETNRVLLSAIENDKILPNEELHKRLITILGDLT